MAHHDACDLIKPKWSAEELLARFRGYRLKRRQLLAGLHRPDSQRDPLSEFAEYLVAALLKAKLAANPVQHGWDVKRPNGSRVQVKYLANPSIDEWPNEHAIRFPAEADEYALVVFVGLAPQWVFVFRKGETEPIYELLKKSHANKESTLQLTRKNLCEIVADPSVFRQKGMQVFSLV